MKEQLLQKLSKVKSLFKKKEKPVSFAETSDKKGFWSYILDCWHQIFIVIFAIVLLYYPIGAFFTNKIDDDLTFSPKIKSGHGSETVQLVADLIDREVNQNTWTANMPFFMAGAVLDNMPNYQTGEFSALSRFAVELTDQIGRARGSSQADKDLDVAAGLLKYPGDVWIISKWMPTASANKQYRQARVKLLSYNERVARGGAVFEARADNLMAALERVSKDLGSSSAVLDKEIREGKNLLIDFSSDDVFYSTKGKLYAYCMILKALGKDFDGVIKEKELDLAWSQMIKSFEAAARMEPVVVVNGSPDGQFLPSHLASQGFYLLRARTQLQEVINIIIK